MFFHPPHQRQSLISRVFKNPNYLQGYKYLPNIFYSLNKYIYNYNFIIFFWSRYRTLVLLYTFVKLFCLQTDVGLLRAVDEFICWFRNLSWHILHRIGLPSNKRCRFIPLAGDDYFWYTYYTWQFSVGFCLFWKTFRLLKPKTNSTKQSVRDINKMKWIVWVDSIYEG